jgi:hypothetical protein
MQLLKTCGSKKKKKNQNVVNENAIKRFVKSRFNLLEYI